MEVCDIKEKTKPGEFEDYSDDDLCNYTDSITDWSNLLTEPKTKTFQCKICSAEFDNTKKKNFKFDDCKHVFPKRNRLKRPKPYKCHLCKASFLDKYNLNLHLLNHCEGRPHYKCETCDKSYSQIWRLNRHKLMHLDENCNLNTHRLLHKNSNTFKFKCELCCKAYYNFRTLQRHICKSRKNEN